MTEELETALKNWYRVNKKEGYLSEVDRKLWEAFNKYKYVKSRKNS